MLDPNTASDHQSIWAGVDRSVFETRVKGLEGRCSPDPISYKIRDRKIKKDSYPVTIEGEAQLADDFAFIAACEPNALYVSAAMILFNPAKKTTQLILAANEGIQERVKAAFEEIVQRIRQCARKGRLSQLCQFKI